MVLLERQIALSKTEQVAAADILNAYFKQGKCIYDDPNMVWLLRAFPYPIIFDANKTLINEGEPWAPNPQSKDALEKASERCSLIIATKAKDWNLRQQTMKNLKLWPPGIIMLNPKNYIPVAGLAGKSIADWLIDEFIKTNRPLGRVFQTTDFNIADPKYKHIAHILGNPFDVPLIDDGDEATHDNPGMKGIQVRPFQTREEMNYSATKLTEYPAESSSVNHSSPQQAAGYSDSRINISNNPLTLTEAVDQALKHYSLLQQQGM